MLKPVGHRLQTVTLCIKIACVHKNCYESRLLLSLQKYRNTVYEHLEYGKRLHNNNNNGFKVRFGVWRRHRGPKCMQLEASLQIQIFKIMHALETFSKLHFCHYYEHERALNRFEGFFLAIARAWLITMTKNRWGRGNRIAD
jgi:hypothetical protein